MNSNNGLPLTFIEAKDSEDRSINPLPIQQIKECFI